jgi:long-chain acyl-CoA synthetase
MKHEQMTVFSLLAEAAAKWGDLPAMHQPAGGKGDVTYRTVTWTQYRMMVEDCALGLAAIGVKKGDFVAIHSETRMEFYIADMAAMAAGAIAAAMYTSYPVPDQVRTLGAFRPKVLMVENVKSLAAFKAQQGMDANIRLVLLTGEAPDALTLEGLAQLGKAARAEDPEAFAKLQATYTGLDYAMLYMTSGATGEPKMGLYRHYAIRHNIDVAPAVIQLSPLDRTLAYLPSAHITQRLVMEILPLGYGMPVWFSESLSKLPGELRSLKPTFFVAPPRLWERMYVSIQTEVKKKPGILQKLFATALGAGLKISRMEQAGEPVPGWLRTTYGLGDKLIFRSVRERLGGAMRYAISGSAPLSKDVAHFFTAIGIPIVEGYGLTEGGVMCLNPLVRPKIGSIGKVFPTVEVKISEEGELLIKGDLIFAGYLNEEEATAKVLQDGWLHTGDLGEIDRDGFVYITGRKKEVIVSSNGKKIYPARLELLFKKEPIINQVVLIGDKLPFVAALITLNMAAVELLDGIEPYRGRATAEIIEAPPVVKAVKDAVSRVNKDLAPFEQIRKFQILEREFSIDYGEVTPTMKIRRSKVLENYRGVVNHMYAGKEEFAG